MMVSHWSLNDNKSPLVSKTLLNILADLKNAVIWMISTCPLIFKSSTPFTNLLRIVPSAPIIIGLTVTLIFYSLYDSLDRSRYLSFRFLLILLSGPPERQNLQLLLLLLLFTLWEFFTSALADGLSLEFEWQQVSSRLQYYYYYYYYYYFQI